MDDWMSKGCLAEVGEVTGGMSQFLNPGLKSSSAQVKNLCHHIFSCFTGGPKAHEGPPSK